MSISIHKKDLVAVKETACSGIARKGREQIAFLQQGVEFFFWAGQEISIRWSLRPSVRRSSSFAQASRSQGLQYG